MINTVIVTEPWDVNRRLGLVGLSSAKLVRVAQAALMARNESTDNDPRNAGGQFAYIYGTRAVREVLRPEGWLVDRSDNIESTYHPEHGFMIIYQNVDYAACPHREPKAISGKGPGMERLLISPSGFLWPEFAEEEKQRVDEINSRRTAEIWFFCVSTTDLNGKDELRAELSCPVRIMGGQFRGFRERIFILSDSELAPIHLAPGDTTGEEFEVEVSRKK